MRSTPPTPAAPQAPDPIAGVLCGVAAGLAYLPLQMLVSLLLLGADPWGPPLRIASILLGPDAAPPSNDVSLSVVGFALLIHLALAAVYGRQVEWATRGDTLPRHVLKGAAIGAALFVLNFWLIAPLAFPWFEQSRNAVTALNHVLFGMVAAVTCHLLRRRRAGAVHARA